MPYPVTGTAGGRNCFYCGAAGSGNTAEEDETPSGDAFGPGGF